MAKILSVKQAELDIGVRPILEGFEVVTETDTHFIGIGDFRNDRESYGYLITEDDPEEFVGCDLLHVHYTGEHHGELFTRAIEEMPFGENNETYFVTFVTDHGSFQIVAYNEHNGRYGHRVVYVKNSKILYHGLV